MNSARGIRRALKPIAAIGVFICGGAHVISRLGEKKVVSRFGINIR